MARKERPAMRQLGVVLVLFLLLLVAGETAGLTDDGLALIDLKKSLVDPNGALSSWEETLVNPCSWMGVTCLANNSVTLLLLQGKGLSGTVSPSLGKLSSLETCRMGNNNISGELPEEIGQLQHLTFLDFGNNRLTGSIPVSLTGMLALQKLLLPSNELSGSIPAALTSLPDLQILDLSHNNLTGPVPENRPGLSFDVSGNPLLQCGESPLPACPGAGDTVPSLRGSSNGSGAGVAAGAAAAGLTVLLAGAGGLIYWKRKREQEMAQEFFDVQDEQGPQIRYAQLREFTLRELNAATDQFSSRNVVGQGGFGKVFRGTLEDGSEVAVKRLNRDGFGGNGMAGNGGGGDGGERAFQTEVEIISMAVHRNLLRLLGYCVTQAERILVYPFMRHGSVASRLRDSSSSSGGKPGEPALDWDARRKIALGAARGLAYLHDFCQPKIIHRDVKAANVLLDDEMEAVVGDFGLAKLLDGSQTHITTIVRGTAGHIAPEYLTTGKSSEKTDVFGYGIMLLELLTGERAFDLARLAVDDVMLLDWVKRLQREGRQAELVDPNLRERYHPDQAQELIQVALLCTQASPGDRPRMAEVVRMLEGDGLAERWQEWQRVELVRRRDSDLHLPLTLPQWVHDSTGNLDAIQLSSGR